MTLRVFLEDEDGSLRFIDYGLNSETVKTVFKVEVREDESKVKSWMGSKWTGIKEIDDETKAREKQEELDKAKKLLEVKVIKSPYEFYDYKKHIDKDWYWVEGKCTNCEVTRQVALRKGNKVIPKNFKLLTCPHCGLKSTFRYCSWDGHKYMIKESKPQ